MSVITSQHHLSSTPETVHWGFFDASLSPVLKVASGDTVKIDCISGLPGYLPSPEQFEILPEILDIFANTKKGTGNHILTGPIFVEGAEIGDVLAVTIIDISLRQDWAWNLFRGYGGTLPEDFPFTKHTIMSLDREQGNVVLPNGLCTPIAPFFGQMAVAPASVFGRQNSKEPRDFGGNIDCKALTAGSTLWLPVWNEGALFSVGDGHAAQGDGEVDGTAAETSLSGIFRFELLKARHWTMPRAQTKTHLVTFGFEPSLDIAAKQALKTMIEWIVELKGVDRTEAYALCSMACDLRVTQTVNINKGVHAMVDKTVLNLNSQALP